MTDPPTSESLRALGPDTLEERSLHLRLWGALDDHISAWKAERSAHADAWNEQLREAFDRGWVQGRAEALTGAKGQAALDSIAYREGWHD